MRFNALLERYQKTVRVSMFGHTHTDIFQQQFSVNSMQPYFNYGTQLPIGTTSVCGSLTTWGGLNPSYCVYTLDKETLLPVERKTFSFNIADANASGTPAWTLFTDWLVDYEMPDLSPSSYYAFAQRLQTDENLPSFYKMKYSRQPTQGSCDEGCRQHLYCDMAYFDPYANRECKGDAIFDWTGNWLGSVRQALLEPWLKPIEPASK